VLWAFQAGGFKIIIQCEGGAMTEANKALKTKLNQETARINWEELQRFYASGTVVAVKPGSDLIDVACHFANDDKLEVESLMKLGTVFQPTDITVQDWYDRQTAHWAVVIAPWILVQEIL
jgi:hypothetical protein